MDTQSGAESALRPFKKNQNNNNKKKANTIGSLQVMRGHVTINEFKENHPLTVFDN